MSKMIQIQFSAYTKWLCKIAKQTNLIVIEIEIEISISSDLNRCFMTTSGNRRGIKKKCEILEIGIFETFLNHGWWKNWYNQPQAIKLFKNIISNIFGS